MFSSQFFEPLVEYQNDSPPLDSELGLNQPQSHCVNPYPPVSQMSSSLCVSQVLPPALVPVFDFEYFNYVQSSSFHVAYHTDQNMVVAAPTGRCALGGVDSVSKLVPLIALITLD